MTSPHRSQQLQPNVCSEPLSTEVYGRDPAPHAGSAAASSVSATSTHDYFEDPVVPTNPEPSVLGLMSKYNRPYPPAGFDQPNARSGTTGSATPAGEPDSSRCDGTAAFQVTMRRFAAFDTFGLIYAGDAKSREGAGSDGFTTDDAATARVTTQLEVWGSSIAATSSSDPSHNVLTDNTATGRPETQVENDVGAGGGHVLLSSAGANPLTPTFATPAIDSQLHVDYCATDDALHVAGELTGDKFPNAEVYVTDEAGNSVLLSTFATGRGQHTGPLLHLWGKGDEVLGMFDETIAINEDGTFRMTCE